MAAGSQPGVRWALFGFSGRLGRHPYALGQFLFLTLAFGTVWQLMKSQGDEGAAAFWGAAVVMLAGASVWASVALTVKRLNDLSWPRILIVCLFIPWVGLGFTVLLMVLQSDPRPNRHGPPPTPPSPPMPPPN